MKHQIPKEVKNILEKLEKAHRSDSGQAGFEAFLVGGCVRDLLLGRKVNDWDVTTNAKPEEIQKLFPDSFYENDFGTVGIKIREDEAPTPDGVGATTDVVEVTPYRKEAQYTDKRHPDKVEFTASLEEDLARRDFTINAIALRITGHRSPATSIVDPFDGQKDLKAKTIKAVGDPERRFEEDALRLMRAVRFSAQLGFKIEEKTKEAIKQKAGSLSAISQERVRDEFLKIIDSDPSTTSITSTTSTSSGQASSGQASSGQASSGQASSGHGGAENGVRILQELGLLKYIIPELEEGVGVEQNLHHKYTVFEHNVRSLGYAAKYGYGTAVRIAALLHDIGKPSTKRGEGEKATFYNHEMVGARMVKKIAERLRLPGDLARKIVTLVRNHMFYYDVGEVTERSVRRLLRRVGPENIDELLEVRIAERKGSGVPKAEPYRLRHLRYMIDKVAQDPISVGMLKVSGEDIMKALDIKPGPKVGLVLNALLEEVLDDPARNMRENLESIIKELGDLPEEELKKLADSGKEKLEEKKEDVDKELKGRHYVK